MIPFFVVHIRLCEFGKNADSIGLICAAKYPYVCLRFVWRQSEFAFFGAYGFGCTHFFIFRRNIFMDSFTFGAIIGSILSGAVVGAVPAICGAIKHKIGLAIGGFFACLVGSLLLGLILSVPLCALFLFLIFKKNQDEPV